MDDSFGHSPKAEDELDLHDELDSSEVDEELYTKQRERLRLSQMATVYPPKPCERCVRMNRTCKGIAGSRCEYCKRLKQKCSNATGPARGRHATRLAMLAAAAAQGISPPPQTSAPSSSSWAVRPKRKTTSGKALAGTLSGDDDDDDYDECGPPVKLSKKRRSSKTVHSPLQSKVFDRIDELEFTIRELQNHTAREVERINQIIGQLKTDVRELGPMD